MVKKMQENFKRKIKELKSATKDCPFLDDLREISEDFGTIDSGEWDF